MRWLFALVAVASCGGGSSSKPVDAMPPLDIQAVCAAHPLPSTVTCGDVPPNYCHFLTTEGKTCATLLMQLPASCNITSDDYIACASATCKDFRTACAAFTACGVQVFAEYGPTQSCG